MDGDKFRKYHYCHTINSSAALGEVRAIFWREVVLWLVQQDLENTYGLLLAIALLVFRIGGQTRNEQYYCLGATLIALVVLVQR